MLLWRAASRQRRYLAVPDEILVYRVNIGAGAAGPCGDPGGKHRFGSKRPAAVGTPLHPNLYAPCRSRTPSLAGRRSKPPAMRMLEEACIHGPIIAYEFLNKPHVQEGNKWVVGAHVL